jgi:hypothetical protein
MDSAPQRRHSRSVVTLRPVDIGAARRYLRAIETVARHGRTARDPRETLAALRTFARPSRTLKDLAGVR